MSVKARPSSKILFRGDLDSEILALPGRSLKNLVGFFAHLELLSQHGDLASLSVLEKFSETSVDKVTNRPPYASKNGITCRLLGRQVLNAAQGQVHKLRHRVDVVQSLVLINNWSVAENLWSELIPQCKTPLFELSLIEELWGLNPDRAVVDGWSITRQWHEFVLIQAEFEILLGRRRSLVEFSDAIERNVGHWLKRLEELLDALDEASAA
jgi:hypothetical protein